MTISMLMVVAAVVVVMMTTTTTTIAIALLAQCSGAYPWPTAKYRRGRVPAMASLGDVGDELCAREAALKFCKTKLEELDRREEQLKTRERRIQELEAALSTLVPLSTDPQYARSAELWTLLGVGWHHVGHARRAEQALLRAVALSPDEPIANFYLGRIYLRRSFEQMMVELPGHRSSRPRSTEDWKLRARARQRPYAISSTGVPVCWRWIMSDLANTAQRPATVAPRRAFAAAARPPLVRRSAAARPPLVIITHN